MSVYRVLKRLCSPTLGRDVLPGETITIEDEALAGTLLDREAITPAEVRLDEEEGKGAC